jgi:hypothetical protein
VSLNLAQKVFEERRINRFESPLGLSEKRMEKVEAKDQ